eukprot:TRINITY_DN5142_c0_g1_i5.p2 TRINITY_DN5142_c0_g1~~TRINITY_DN5142_c0_g1_i5.p2  ORF type:complete len:223 (-),score=61.75 TRINITY_DN5142_c0_g1_i5:127-795(-)
MEICVEARHTVNVRSLHQQTNKLRFEVSAKIDALEMNYNQQTAERDVARIQALLNSFAESLGSLKSAVGSQGKEEQEEWSIKVNKLLQCEKELRDRFERTLSQLRRRNANGRHKLKAEEDSKESELNQLMKDKEGLEASRKIALEIQNYGNMVWSSIVGQSNKLKGAFSRTGQINDGMDVSHAMANKLFKNDRADCYIFLGLAFLTIALIFVCYYYIKPLLF